MRYLSFSVLIAAVVASPAFAQEELAPLREPPRATFDLLAGGMQGVTELNHGTRFGPSPAYGVSATYWVEPTVGIGLHALYSDASVETDHDILARQDPDVWLLAADLAVRSRFSAAGQELVPYVKAGLGAKRFGFEEPYYAPAVNLRGGVHVPVGRVQLFIEGGASYSEIHTLGLWEDQSDWLYGAGLSIPLGDRDLTSAHGSLES